MSLLLLLTGAPQGGQGIPPEPVIEPEVEAGVFTPTGGGAWGRGGRRILAVTREYRDAEDEFVMLMFL